MIKFVNKGVAQMKTYSVVIIGAGRRGSTYANEMLKLGNKFKVVGVADPIKERHDLIQNKFHFTPHIFPSVLVNIHSPICI